MLTLPILAIDGGGTCCRGAGCDKNGKVLIYSESGACNYQNVGIEHTRKTLLKLLQEIMDDFNEGRPFYIDILVIGMAGVDTEQDRHVVEGIIYKVLQQTRLTIGQLILKNDALMTLYGVTEEGPGLLVLSGTGSIICGKNEDDQSVRVGGWGHRIGDEGSGYAIGHAAVHHIFRAFDGQDPPSLINRAILDYLNLTSTHELIHWLYQPHFSIEQMAALAPIVFKLAREGDVTAINILENAGRELASACRTAIDRLNLKKKTFTLSLGGGILQKDDDVANFLKKELYQEYDFIPNTLTKDPIYYVLLFALRIQGVLTVKTKERCEITLTSWQNQQHHQ